MTYQTPPTSAYAQMIDDPVGTADKMLKLTTRLSILQRNREEIADELVDVKLQLAAANDIIANIRAFLPDIQQPGRY